MARYCYNSLVVCPVFAVLKALTETYIGNYFIAGGILVGLELIIGVLYLPNLYRKHAVEMIEDIPSFKIVSDTAGLSKSGIYQTQIKSNINAKDAATYLRIEIGEKASD